MWPNLVSIADELCEYTSDTRINLQDMIGRHELTLSVRMKGRQQASL
jgi:hypothetical protein